MPAGLVALLPALITAGTTATEIGLQASGAFQPSTSAQTKALEEQTANQQKQLQDAKMQAFRKFAPDVQGQTGGALTDKSFSQMVAELAGEPGDLNLAQKTLFGDQSGEGGGLASGGGLNA